MAYLGQRKNVTKKCMSLRLKIFIHHDLETEPHERISFLVNQMWVNAISTVNEDTKTKEKTLVGHVVAHLFKKQKTRIKPKLHRSVQLQKNTHSYRSGFFLGHTNSECHKRQLIFFLTNWQVTGWPSGEATDYLTYWLTKWQANFVSDKLADRLT